MTLFYRAVPLGSRLPLLAFGSINYFLAKQVLSVGLIILNLHLCRFQSLLFMVLSSGHPVTLLAPKMPHSTLYNDACIFPAFQLISKEAILIFNF
jgi:hypothetical protein